MKRQNGFFKKAAAIVMAAGLTCAPVYAAGDYDTYSMAYLNVMAGNGFDADINASFTMDGETVNAAGNFKVDNSGEKPQLLLTVDVAGETITQFSDGDFLYVEARGEKSKYPLGQKAEQEDSRKDPAAPEGEAEETAAPEFTVSDFLQEFASCLEAGKIQEMGLMTPLDENLVTKIDVDGNTYSLTVVDLVLAQMTNILSSGITMEGDSVSFSDLTNFKYEAVIEDDYVTGLTIGGTMDVTIPSSVSGTGEEKVSPLDMTIEVSFNDPGSQVSVTLPDTEGF